jgi:outer membrane protein OmpA-like peptidoglycan-associated protein
MKQAMKWTAVAGLIALVALSAGCSAHREFRESIDGQSARVDEVQSGVEANERRIGDLRSEVDGKISANSKRAAEAMDSSRAAMDAARAADAKAGGKVLWEVTISSDDVKFESNKAVLTADGKSALDGLIGRVKGYDKAAYVEIQGHTDSTGTDEYNMGLGLERAEAVRGYMSEQGVPLHMMSVISFGETNPVADNADSGGRAQNRRVVVRVLE